MYERGGTAGVHDQLLPLTRKNAFPFTGRRIEKNGKCESVCGVRVALRIAHWSVHTVCVTVALLITSFEFKEFLLLVLV